MALNLSLGWLFAPMSVSAVGLGLFVYGKREVRAPQLLAGLVLMIYPAFVASTAWVWAIGVLIVAGLWGLLQLGL